MKTLNTVFIASALALLAPAAAAEGGYVGLAGGLWMPETRASGPVVKLDNGVTGELRGGWQLTPRFAVEGAFGALQAEHSLPAADVTETTLHTISGWYAGATVLATAPLGDGRWQAFGGGGLGFYAVDVSLKDPPSSNRDESEDDVGYHLTGGLRVSVSSHVDLGLEYRWVSVEPGGVELGGSAALLAFGYRF